MVDPYNSIPSTPSVQSDKDSASAEDAKSAERRADVARAFRGTLSGTNAASSGTLGGAASTASPRQGASAAKSPLGGRGEQTFLSPALMKLQQQGYPIPTGVPEKKVMPQYERGGGGGGGGADSGGSLGGEGGRGESKEIRSRSSQDGEVKRSNDAAMDPTRQVSAASNAAQAHGRRQGKSGQGDAGAGGNSSDGSTPDPRLLAGAAPMQAAQQFQATMGPQAAGRPMPPPELVQQLVEFAHVHTTADGVIEFNLGLVRDALGGLRIQLSAYGNRRVGLTIKGRKGQKGIGEQEVAGLIDALRERNVEVVDVVVE
jgi:hypothetical protein